jgi:ABC-type transport system involved in cytochrome c biogenesis permease subunit
MIHKMLSNISVVCFAASYAVALALEVTRLLFRSGIRVVVIFGFAAAGMLAHTSYLVHRAQEGLATRGAPLSNWYHWFLVAAWVLAAIYLGLLLKRAGNPMGIFLLPPVLGLIGLAQLFPRDQTFPKTEAYRVWSLVHGGALLLGTATVLFGFAAGVMYLAQSYRLKQKLPPREGFRLPSLEWLQRTSEGSLVVSSFLLAVGLLAGVVLNLIQHGDRSNALPWTDPVVLSSGVLLFWLILVLVFSYFYKPARQGRKVAYLTFASLVFLLMVLAIMLLGQTQHVGGALARTRLESNPIPAQAAVNSRSGFQVTCPAGWGDPR